MLIETLEHLDDLQVIENIPQGKNIIFSVPTFDDPAHVRVYPSENFIKNRFKGLDIKSIELVGNIFLIEANK